MLQDQHAKDDVGWRAEPAAAPAQRQAAFQSLGDQLDEGLVLECGVDPPQCGIPELVTVGQQHLEDAALAMRATDHGTSGAVGRLQGASGQIAVGNITNDDEAAPPDPSTKLCVRALSLPRRPHKQRPSCLTFAPESS